MATQERLTNPLSGDEVPKVDNAVAIGEDLGFQERWWKFERLIWIFFALVLLADVLGLFGRGWLAKAKMQRPGTGLSVDYERIERASTPSIMKVRFLPEDIQNGAVQLYVSESVVKELGAQRVVPQPEHSALADNGILYTFAATGGTMEIQIALESSFPGVHDFSLQVPGRSSASARVLVMP